MDGDNGGLGENANVDEGVPDDGLDPLQVAEAKIQDVITNMLDVHKNQIHIGVDIAIEPTVENQGHTIFKLTLFLQLNDNPFHSKGGLTKVTNSIYFNNSVDYLNATYSSNTCMFGLGGDCGVYSFNITLLICPQ